MPQNGGIVYLIYANICTYEVDKMEKRFFLVEASVLPEVFLRVLKAKELLASGEAKKYFFSYSQSGDFSQCLL